MNYGMQAGTIRSGVVSVPGDAVLVIGNDRDLTLVHMEEP